MTTARSLMPDPPPVTGQVFAARVSRGDPVEITLNGYGPEHSFEPVTWMTETLPVRGDHCLAFLDVEGGWWAFGIPIPT